MAANITITSRTQAKSTITQKQSRALERTDISSSVPWNKPALSEIKIKDSEKSSHSCQPWRKTSSSKRDLKPVQTLTECLELLQKLSEEVNNISQMKAGRMKAAPEGSTKEPDSLESGRKLILHWAKELEQITVKTKQKSTDEWARRRDDSGEKEKKELEKHNERLQKWAVELKNIKEANGVSDEELKKLLYPKGWKESRMTAILPFLEFVAWSLLSQDTEEAVSKLWLPTKQKKGSGRPIYIPDSVWQWIRSASVSVHLDATSKHSSLVVSPDRLQVQEAVLPTAPSHSSQRFAEWPTVLGDIMISAGRHYWEVEVSPSGNWRVGVMSELASTRQKSMTPKEGYWVLWKGPSLWACTDKAIKLEKVALPRHIGVYVDVREGQVSFYDVERRVHIYTFSDTFRHSLIPLFGCLDGDTVLKIKPAEMLSKH
ncbi:nuclear factor 7, brain-like [Acanthochromis polyacanthus]|uniref:Nuclear factor 7, brain-like n=1 Tax=Acanthochromis polyacanthus TaxID=80966 RepID=A0A3Q1HS18_9TELE|nr:nuclear factor 7, brain-like [Acanthochromis polyacanthus]XP_051806512.1 nuclear factor 7, brain-like [Acanthochromis polyacanthus]